MNRVARLDRVDGSLGGNRAYSGGACRLPPMRALPEEPFAPCRGRSECTKEGAAICYVQLFGSEGCGMAFRGYGIPNTISSPACGAAVAELAKEKYGLGAVVMDVLQGLAEDQASSLWNSDSTDDQAKGALLYGLTWAVKLTRAQSCTSSFVERFYGPRERWLADVSEIEGEPRELYERCTADLSDRSASVAQIARVDAKIAAMREETAARDATLATLSLERRKLSYCPD
jgi:hypothetical protein